MLIHKRLRDLIQGVEVFVFGKSLLSVCVSLTYIAQAVLFGQVIQMLYESAGMDALKWHVFWIAFLILVRLFLITGLNVYGKWIIGQIKNRLRKRTFIQLMKLGPAYLLDERSGEIQSKAMAGIDYLEGYLSLYIPQILTVFIVLAGISIYVFSIHFALGILILATAVAALFMPYLFLYKITSFSEEHWAAYTDLSAEFVETVQGMMTLKAFNASKRVGTGLKDKMHRLFDKTMKSLTISLMETGLANFCVTIGRNFTLALAAYFTVNGTIRVGQMAMLFFLVAEAYRPLQELGQYFHQGFMGITSCDGIFEILDEEIKIQDVGESVNLTHSKPEGSEIVFSDVEFGYPESKTTLFHNLNLRIAPNEKLAFAGESGGGKTTIARLLLRFYDPDSGSIRLGGVDYRELPLSELRKQFSVVSQETYLFYGTIMENLLLANPKASEEEVKQAAKLAQIHDFIQALPQGYESRVGEKGVNFSGGERQRMAIARALLKNAPIIIFDEASSSVDTKIEKEIQEHLQDALKDKTTITIAHRLSTIQNASRICVLRHGEIIEEGTHEDLMKGDTYYSYLFATQEAAEQAQVNEQAWS